MTTNLIFHRLFNAAHIEIVGLGFTKTLSKNKGGVSGVLEVLKKTDYRYWLFLVFTNGFFVLNRLTSIFLRKPSRRHKHLLNLANDLNIPVFFSSHFSSKEFIEELKLLNVDLLLIRVNQILSAELLQVPQIDTWCVHSSLLPSYKGIAGEFHSINNGEHKIGSTIFQVTPKLDEGRSIAQTSMTIRAKKSLFYHLYQNNLNAADLVLEKVSDLSENRKIKFEKLAPRKASYYSWPKPTEVSSFLQFRNLIDPKEIITFATRCIFKTEL